MAAEHDHPTGWEKWRDNMAPALAVAIIIGLFNMYGTQREILSVLSRLEKRVDRIESRLDNHSSNGSEDR